MSGKVINTITHGVKTLLKPWTHLDFPENTGMDYHFAIVSDRAGRPRAGVFENAIDKINKMMPDFVMSVGDYIDGICVEDQSVSFLEKQWKTFLPMVKKCIPPLFFLMGNHDCIPPGAGSRAYMKEWKNFISPISAWHITISSIKTLSFSVLTPMPWKAGAWMRNSCSGR